MKTSHASTVLGWLSLATMALGLALGLFLPVHSGTWDCGTPFLGADRVWLPEACDTARDTPRLAAIIILGVGAVLGVAALAQGWVEAKQEEQATS
jgi:hypothetical protein